MEEKLTEELITTDRKLVFQIEEKAKRGSELVLSNIVDSADHKKDEEYTCI